jgi:hypothetical protein
VEDVTCWAEPAMARNESTKVPTTERDKVGLLPRG